MRDRENGGGKRPYRNKTPKLPRNKTNQGGSGRLGSGSPPVRTANTFSNSLRPDAPQRSANLPVRAEDCECSGIVSGRTENLAKTSPLVAFIIKLNSGEFPIKILPMTPTRCPNLHCFANSKPKAAANEGVLVQGLTFFPLFSCNISPRLIINVRRL